MVQYQSLYRKWRPQSFEDIVGQDHITKTLQNAIRLNRITHAYLFSGPRGVGKTTTARIFAKALNCQNGPTEHPCNNCSQCMSISRGQSIDVLEIDGASNRGIEEIRQLRSTIGFAPAEGKFKVYIIDEVHMLTAEAFNALLKTLEEPPNKVLFIFATTALHKVPKTILSRCQCFYFRRISIEEMIEKLGKIAEKEKINIDLSSLRLIAEHASGSMRDAESILDQVITYSNNEVTTSEVRDILGLIPQEIFRQLIEAIITCNTVAGLTLINDLVREGVDLGQFIQDLLIYAHNISLLKVLGNDNTFSNFYLEESEREKILALIEATDIKRIIAIIEELKTTEERIKFHHYPWVLLELMIVKLTCVEGKAIQVPAITDNVFDKKDIAIKEEKKELLKITNKTGKDIYAAEKEKKANIENKKNYQLEKIWNKVLLRIKEEKISLYAFLTAGNNIRLEDDQLVISFQADFLFHKESLEKKENKKIVEAIFKEETNRDIKLHCIIEDKGTKEGEKVSIEKEKDIIKNNNLQDEVVVSQKKKNYFHKEKLSPEDEILKMAHDLFGGVISEE